MIRRLFIGIELPGQVKDILALYLSQLPPPKKGWERFNDLHLTLLFIGESSEEKYREIESLLEGINLQSFDMSLLNVKFFNRRIMYIEVEKTHELSQLKDRINHLLIDRFPVETRDFVPHITIKRWQRYEYNELNSMISQHPFSPVNFTVREIALFESRKDEHGDKYHILSRYS